MRYTEARLTPIARLLLDEIDEGTVDFMPNYDGTTRSPSCCPRACRSCCSTAPAASPSAWPRKCRRHNLREVAEAAVALIRKRKLSTTS
jgi:topoisomerase-4 subunit A